MCALSRGEWISFHDPIWVRHTCPGQGRMKFILGPFTGPVNSLSGCSSDGTLAPKEWSLLGAAPCMKGLLHRFVVRFVRETWDQTALRDGLLRLFVTTDLADLDRLP